MALNQVKKHYKQMSKKEIYYLASYMRSIKKFSRSEHFKKRVEERSLTITLNDIKQTIHDDNICSNILEYNEITYTNNKIYQRVLIRINKQYRNIQGTAFIGYVVVDLTRSEIITGFYNPITSKFPEPIPNRHLASIHVRHVKKGGYSARTMQGVS